MVRSGVRLGPAIRRALLIGAAAALVPLPWYLRSLVGDRKPGLPGLVFVFGASPPERWDAVTERSCRLQGPLRLWAFARRPDPAALGCHRPWRSVRRLPRSVVSHADSGSLPLSTAASRRSPAHRRSDRLRGGLGVPDQQLSDAVPHAVGRADGAACRSRSRRCLARGGRMARAGAAAGRRRSVQIAFLNLPPLLRMHERDREGWANFLTHVLRQSPLADDVGGT